MSETIYFNDKGTNYKAEWLEENYPEYPRDENYQTNLGTMVFAKNSRYNLGDKQVDDFSDFFKSQLSEKDFPSYTQGSIIFDFPDVEDAKKNSRLAEFVYTNEEGEELFNKIDFIKKSFNENLDIIKNKLGSDVCEELSSSIPLRSDGSCENWSILNFKTSYGVTEYSEIQKAVEEELSKYGLKITSVHPEEINQLEELSGKELYKKWAETKACVIPLSLYEHSGLAVHASGEEYNVYGEIANSGFIYVDKDNPEFLNELQGEARDKDGTVYNKWSSKTEEEAEKWAEGILKAEIEEYDAYLEGDVHDVNISYFDKEKMEWVNNDYGSMIYGSSLEANLSEHGFDTSHKLTETQVFALENTVNPEFKAAVGKDYIEAIKKELADFDNNPKLAAKSVSKQWSAKEDVNIETSGRVNRWTLKKQALNEYFKDNGCDSPEKIFSFLAEKTGVRKVEQTLEPLSFTQSGYECYFSQNKNSQSSANGAVHSALLIDHKNKRFSYVSGVEYMLSEPSETYLDKVICLSSAKKVENECEKLVKAGYKNSPADPKLEDYRYKDDRIKKYILKEPERER